LRKSLMRTFSRLSAPLIMLWMKSRKS
jgi:hypothetical protein